MEIKPKSKEGWNAIQWSTIEIHVRKLQKRIYLASKNDDIKMVRMLQHNLIKSYDAKLLATRRVTQDNSGKKTAGVDGIKSIKPADRLFVVNKIRIEGKTKPLRRVWIDKSGKTEKRPLGIPTISDRINQALLKLALEPEWEAKFEPNSYGFRPGRKAQDALKQIYLSIFKKPKYVLDADIKKCFDKIDHKKLLAKLSLNKGKLHQQIKAWLKAGVINNDVFEETESGTPQEGIISPLLANIALHGMETMIKELMKTIPLRTPQGKSMNIRDKQRSISVIRFADDFVVMHYDKDVIFKCKEAIQIWLADIGLELSGPKTRITHTLELSEQEKLEFNVEKPGFNFLDFTVRQFKSKYGSGKLNGINTLIWPSNISCKKHQRKLALIIKKSKTVSQEILIKKLNPIISGWGRYFGFSDASTCRILTKLDQLLYLKLRRWSKRKTKSAAAGFRKYWVRINNRWTFAVRNASNSIAFVPAIRKRKISKKKKIKLLKKINTFKIPLNHSSTKIKSEIKDNDHATHGKPTNEVKLFNHTNYSESIRTYVKVSGECSPFDNNEVYWATRMGINPLMPKSQSMLLKKQKGLCNFCKLMFKDDDVFEIDHIKPLSVGGEKEYINLQLLHRHCHDQKSKFI